MAIFKKYPIESILAVLWSVFLGYLIWQWLHEPRFNEHRCREIEVGMTRGQVEKILGMPPNTTTRMRGLFIPNGVKLGLTEWMDREGMITVYFDEHDRVRRPAEFDSPRIKPGFLDPFLDVYDDLVESFSKWTTKAKAP